MKIRLDETIDLLNAGRVAAIPTETVYGLAASIAFPEAISEIYRLKKRPAVNPLIVHVADYEDVSRLGGKFPPRCNELAEAFWPGPMTLILPLTVPMLVPAIARAQLPTAGFRIPDHLETREILRETGPLVMPSANLSGRPSATTADHVLNDFGNDFPVYDGGKCVKGLESTILYYRGERGEGGEDGEWVILRLGSIAGEEFKRILGYEPVWVKKEEQEGKEGQEGKVLSPGQQFRHYAPEAKLILASQVGGIQEGMGKEAGAIDAIIGFRGRDYSGYGGVKKIYFFESAGGIDEVDEVDEMDGANLVGERVYSLLRQLDEEGMKCVLLDDDFPDHGLWITIRERLHRATRH